MRTLQKQMKENKMEIEKHYYPSGEYGWLGPELPPWDDDPCTWPEP